MYTASWLLQWFSLVQPTSEHYVDQQRSGNINNPVWKTNPLHRFIRKSLALALSLCTMCWGMCLPVQANEFPDASKASVIDLGTPLSSEQLEALSQHIFADGTGLPEGSGTAEQGAGLYSAHCASCHGSAGQGGKALELVGDRSLLATDYPDKGIAVYWPNATTLYEYIRRSMPPATPGMFSDNELYALIAHLLELNGLIEADAVLDRQLLIDVQMPNKNGFNTIAR